MLNLCRTLYDKRRAADKSHIDLACITHFYCNQILIDSITLLLRQYETCPSNILARTEFSVVDDCSVLEYNVPGLNLHFRALRVTTDSPWNQGGPRRLRGILPVL